MYFIENIHILIIFIDTLDWKLWDFAYSNVDFKSLVFRIKRGKRITFPDMGWLESNALYKGSLTCPLPERTFFNIREVPVTAPGYRLSHFLPFLDTKTMWWWTLEKVLATQRLLYSTHRIVISHTSQKRMSLVSACTQTWNLLPTNRHIR